VLIGEVRENRAAASRTRLLPEPTKPVVSRSVAVPRGPYRFAADVTSKIEAPLHPSVRVEAAVVLSGGKFRAPDRLTGIGRSRALSSSGRQFARQLRREPTAAAT
jgi:hypothetical protein